MKWKYAGSGGYDTEYWSVGGVCITFPGIRQILHYGVFNLEWWAAYMYREFVVKRSSDAKESHP